jgi:hypothetical protein
VPWQPEDGWITWSQHPNSYSLPIIAQFNGQDPYYFLDEDLGRLLEWQKGAARWFEVRVWLVRSGEACMSGERYRGKLGG